MYETRHTLPIMVLCSIKDRQPGNEKSGQWEMGEAAIDYRRDDRRGVEIAREIKEGMDGMKE